MRVLAHRHTALVVDNLENVIRFYTALGFEQRRRDLEEGEFICHLTGLDNVVMETVKLSLEDGYVLELIKHISHSPFFRPEDPVGFHPPRFGLDHLGLTVDDINDVIQTVRALGGRVISLPKWTNPGLPSIHAYVSDPEGNVIHLSENA